MPQLLPSEMLGAFNLILMALISSLGLLICNVCWWQPMAKMRRLKQQGFQVLPYTPVVGNALTVHRMLEAARRTHAKSPSDHDIMPLVMPFHNNASQIYGKRYIYWWGTMPVLTITNPEEAREVLSTKFKHYEKYHAVVHVFQRVFGKGLLSVVGQDWDRHRRILSPAFYSDKLKAMATDMVFCASQLCTKWETIVQNNGGSAEIEVDADLKIVTADIIGRTCFGSSYEKGRKVFQNQRLVGHYLFKDLLLNFAVPGYRYIPTPTNLKCWRLEKEVEKDLREIVESRRDAMRKNGAGGGSGVDLLGIMLSENEKLESNSNSGKQISSGLTTQEVMDQCKTFFFAGHETTASLLSWAMLLLAVHPEWQERCREEVLEVCGHKTALDADFPNRLRYVGMVLNETLRLYPSVTELVAREQRDEGMCRAIMVAAIHRDKAFWGNDANEFKPERFANGIGQACGHTFAFLPFAGGPRNCVGQSFAMLEAKLVMAAILKQFHFCVAPSYVHSPQAGITLTPNQGLHLTLSLA